MRKLLQLSMYIQISLFNRKPQLVEQTKALSLQRSFFCLLVSSGGSDTNCTILLTSATSTRNFSAIFCASMGPLWSSALPWCSSMMWRSCATFKVPGGAALSSNLPESGFVSLSFGSGLLYLSTTCACTQFCTTTYTQCNNQILEHWETEATKLFSTKKWTTLRYWPHPFLVCLRALI